MAVSAFPHASLIATTSKIIEYIIGGTQTLAAGSSAITVSGTEISLDPGGETVVIGGSSTVALSAFLSAESGDVRTTTGTELGIGGIIASLGGFGPPDPSPTTTDLSGSIEVGGNGTLLVFTGAGSREGGRGGDLYVWALGLVLSVGVWGVGGL